MSENAKKFTSDTRLVLLILLIEKSFDMVNMTWLEVLIPLYILIAFYIIYFIWGLWKS